MAREKVLFGGMINLVSYRWANSQSIPKKAKLPLMKIGAIALVALACIGIIGKDIKNTKQPSVTESATVPTLPTVQQPIKEQAVSVLPHNSEIYIWTSKSGTQYITADSFLVPENNYIALDFTRVDNRKTYTMVGVSGVLSKTKGVPMSTRQKKLRLISVK